MLHPAHRMQCIRVAEPALWGLVLAGGHSRRLGRDKAAVLYEGSPLLERAVQLLRPVVESVYVSVREDQAHDELRRRYALVTDSLQTAGPAAGILAAHSANPRAAWLVLACDMPRVGERDLAALVRGRNPALAATAFRQPGDGRPEPLCAIYEPATLARFQDLVQSGGHASPRDLLASMPAVLLDPPDAQVLGSINTPDDLRRLTTGVPGDKTGTPSEKLRKHH
jgi:molybdopterin-guanine dinucleotide biosynthesis protein A